MVVNKLKENAKSNIVIYMCLRGFFFALVTLLSFSVLITAKKDRKRS